MRGIYPLILSNNRFVEQTLLGGEVTLHTENASFLVLGLWYYAIIELRTGSLRDRKYLLLLSMILGSPGIPDSFILDDHFLGIDVCHFRWSIYSHPICLQPL